MINHSQDRRKNTIRLSNEGEGIMNETLSNKISCFPKRIQSASKAELTDLDRAIDIYQKRMPISIGINYIIYI